MTALGPSSLGSPNLLLDLELWENLSQISLSATFLRLFDQLEQVFQSLFLL